MKAGDTLVTHHFFARRGAYGTSACRKVGGFGSQRIRWTPCRHTKLNNHYRSRETFTGGPWLPAA